MNTEFS